MKHTITKIKGNKKAVIEIRLDDECNNGHQDFVITASIYERTDKESGFLNTSSGCCHDDILELAPELKIFVNLHLCDYTGAPMHATANGYYHLQDTTYDPPMKPDEFIKYYRINKTIYKKLLTAESETHFNYLLTATRTPERWQKQATKAIKILEKMTGEKFVNTSQRTQFTPLDSKQTKAIKKLVASGYYSTEKRAERANLEAEAQRVKQVAKLVKDCENTIKKARINRDIKLELFRVGGKRALNACIFYDHSGELCINYNKKYTRHNTHELLTTIEIIKIEKDCTFPKAVKHIKEG